MTIKEIIKSSASGELEIEFSNGHFINTPFDLAEGFDYHMILIDLASNRPNSFMLLTHDETESISKKIDSLSQPGQRMLGWIFANANVISDLSDLESFLEWHFREREKVTHSVLRFRFYIEKDYLKLQLVDHTEASE